MFSKVPVSHSVQGGISGPMSFLGVSISGTRPFLGVGIFGTRSLPGGWVCSEDGYVQRGAVGWDLRGVSTINFRFRKLSQIQIWTPVTSKSPVSITHWTPVI